ncbi:hypothetical protein EUX98_g6524 [Antrodiella citrinella]|uniref:Bromo domain-containing protein n=1 Tax=Antrodiella citrinella TaxID=2447956 RepID=A0A4S4MNR9_9APHY|nr:hypothetical protein EUX98_g6524 [Antrodiella citrinella]
MSKREASMFAAQGVVDVDAPRAKRHKPGPQGHSSSTGQPSSPAKDEQHGAANGREVKQEQIEGAEDAVVEDPEVVKEKALKVWQTVKDAVNKEGRILSVDFMRLPNKRQYSDYYTQIKHPISLDEIKDRIEDGAYLTFNDCINDLETCFKNAKRYNIRESQIWKDAKVLHKLVTNEVVRLSGGSAAQGDDADAAGAGGSDVEAEGGKKKKQPNMSRVMKAKLQKLVDKTNSDGRVLSIEFMELPSKKQWPVYYKAIKKPQCIENIFKKLKRKEYHTPTDFANDVELVFSNALEFNQEHTDIWEDALVLRDYFRQLMSDLPPPFDIPAYSSSDHSTKIKLRMPNAAHSQQPSAAANPNPIGGTLMLRVPPQASPSSVTPQLPNSNSINVKLGKNVQKLKNSLMVSETALSPAPPPVAPSTLHPSHTQTVPPHIATSDPHSQQSLSFAQPAYTSNLYAAPHISTTMSHQSRQSSQQRTPITVTTALPNPNIVATRQQPYTPVQTQVLTLAPPKGASGYNTATSSYAIAPRHGGTTMSPMISPAAAMTTTTLNTGTATVASKSPTPTTASRQRRLEHVRLVTKPNGRRLDLDARDGVKTWAVRLGVDELSVGVTEVKFFPSDDDGNVDEDVDADRMDVDGSVALRKEEEETGDEEEAHATTNQTPPKRPRGRPRKNAVKAPVVKPVESKGKAKARGELQLKLNGMVVPYAGRKGEWDVKLPGGYNVLEIGETGGMVWRVYLERVIINPVVGR